MFYLRFNKSKRTFVLKILFKKNNEANMRSFSTGLKEFKGEHAFFKKIKKNILFISKRTFVHYL